MSDVPPPVPPPGAPGPASGQPNLTVGDALGYAWAKFQQHAGALILIALIIALVNFLGSILRLVVDDFFLATILALLLFVVGQIVTIGVINAALMVTRGETPTPGAAFSTEKLGAFVIASVLYGLIVLVGIVLCVIPGIIAAFMLGFYGFYVLDQDMEPTAALSASFNLVKDNFGVVFLVALVAILLNFVGALLCGIGLLVTAPVCWIMFGYAYRKLNNQPIAP